MRKRFGQHFLEPAWVEKVMRVIAPEPDQTFLEIGPGRGALTKPLASRARHVLAFEIDRDLAAELRQAGVPNVTVVEGDFLKISADRLNQELAAIGRPPTLRVAGNLPYNVASPILFRLIALHAEGMPFLDATVMLQREVSDRLTARPGTRDYGALTVLVGHSVQVERLLNLPPVAFRPQPKVFSSLVRLRFHRPSPPAKDPFRFATLVQALFTRRRKTLSNALKAVPFKAGLVPADALVAAGLDGRRRPETLTIPELVRLADLFSDDTVPRG